MTTAVFGSTPARSAMASISQGPGGPVQPGGGDQEQHRSGRLTTARISAEPTMRRSRPSAVRA